MSEQFLNAEGLNYYHQGLISKLEDEINNKENKLPIIKDSSTNRLLVSTPTQYTPTGATERQTGTKIGDVVFTNTPVIENDSPIITNISDLAKPTNKYYCAILARVAELYIMEDTVNGGTYAPYIKATVKNNTVSFYWTYPYYFKRVSGEQTTKDATQATSGGGSIGVVTTHNYFNKWNAGEINAGSTISADDYATYLFDYYKYHVCNIGSTEPTKPAVKFHLFNTLDNEEPYDQTLVTRQPSGQITIENGTAAFHAVNLRQLNAKADELSEKIQAVKDNISGKSLSQDWAGHWITIATTQKVRAFGDFEVCVHGGPGGSETFLKIQAEVIERNNPTVQLNVSNYSYRYRALINGVRVAIDDSTNQLVLQLQLSQNVATSLITKLNQQQLQENGWILKEINQYNDSLTIANSANNANNKAIIVLDTYTDTIDTQLAISESNYKKLQDNNQINSDIIYFIY